MICCIPGITYNYCGRCPFGSNLRSSVERHIKRKHLMKYSVEPFWGTNEPEQHKCDKCSFSTKYLVYLKEHVENVHDDGRKTDRSVIVNRDSDMYKCKKCESATNSVLVSARHCECEIADNIEEFGDEKCAVKDVSSYHVKLTWHDCNQCSFRTNDKEFLNSHIISEHTVVIDTKLVWDGQCSNDSKAEGDQQVHKGSNPAKPISFTAEDSSSKTKSSEKLKCAKESKNSSHKPPQNKRLSKHTTSKNISEQRNRVDCSVKTKSTETATTNILNEHKRTEKMKWFKCAQCDYKSTNMARLEEHKIASCQNLATCEKCSFKTKSRSNMKRHVMSRHTAEKDATWYRCITCSYKSIRVDRLKTHVRKLRHSLEWFPCKDCSFKAYLRPQLDHHITSKHTVAGVVRSKYVKRKPKKDTEKEKTDSLNCQVSLKPFLVVPQCNFLRRSTRIATNRTTNQDPLSPSTKEPQLFHCEQPDCLFKANFKQDLETHILIKHAIEKDIPRWLYCARCPYKSTVKKYLRHHVLMKHILPKNKSTCNQNVNLSTLPNPLTDGLECDRCSFLAVTVEQLRSHNLEKHTSSRAVLWFKCAKCFYKSKKKISLRQHCISKHEDDQDIGKLQCEQCQFKATNKAGMHRHIFYRHK